MTNFLPFRQRAVNVLTGWLSAFLALVFVPSLAAEEFNPRVVLRRPLRPITSFPIKTVREVGDSLNPSELVLGVTVGKKSRAYPINMLTGPSREILNDTLGGKAIAATW